MYIQTLFDRVTGVKETWYDTAWNKQDFYYFSDKHKDVQKPASLGEMLQVAAKLSAEFAYVRVDLYEVYGKVYFGELTFKPYAGFMKWQPTEWDLKMGKMLKLPIDE